ncbi:MAG TPA: tetratricopeptide repeat protein [Terriglobales bacterium]|nr:tetratricopeptide repeat protein [Terriglobales bacterium]
MIRVEPSRGGTIQNALLLVVSLLYLVCWSGQALSQEASTILIRGQVKNAHGAAVQGVSVELREVGKAESMKDSTDQAGNFQFKLSAQGEYVLHAAAGTDGTATSQPFRVELGKETRVDLILKTTNTNSDQPAFDDEPQFTVAGVTDPTNLGGHGSNATASTKAEITRDTTGLKIREAQRPATAVEMQGREQSLRQRLAEDPLNLEANIQLGELLTEANRCSEALPLLERAHTLAEQKGALAQASVFSALARLEEQSAKPLEALRYYQRAAELDPSEAHLFDWGAELLKHNAAEPATKVFSKGNRQFPKSTRMLIGLGTSWYVRGDYEQAVRCMAAASDLSPNDPVPYTFLGKLLSVDSGKNDVYTEKFRRFTQLQPASGPAAYYYALSLWKRRTASQETDLTKIRSLLEKALDLDRNLGVAHLLLGSLFSEQGDLQKAIAAYQRATSASPKLADGHYRLAQAYQKAGEAAKAGEELKIYNQLSKQAAEQQERDWQEMRQFVYTLGKESISERPK